MSKVMFLINKYQLVITILFLFLLFQAPNVQSGELTKTLNIAAASDLRFALDDIISLYNSKNKSVKIAVSYGSSGNFYTQITQGAPFDIFFTAESTHSDLLIKTNHTNNSNISIYGRGHLVLWVSKDSSLDINQGLNILKDSRIKRISIANPAHAPYGRAAESAFISSNIYNQIKDKLVLGENISQAFQFVQSGSADIGVVALSLAKASSMKDSGRYWNIPDNIFPPIIQKAIVLNSSKYQKESFSFVNFVLSEGKAILTRYGFN